jgi:hypothetical protein
MIVATDMVFFVILELAGVPARVNWRLAGYC